MRLGPPRVFALVFVALAGLVAGATLASCSGDDEASPPTTTSDTTTTTTATTTSTTTETQTQTTPAEKPTVIRVTVRGGVPAGGIVRRSVDKGDRAVLIVSSDIADEVHLHGYDLIRNVAPGHRARIAFRATIPGRFEVELEERAVPIAELTVRP